MPRASCNPFIADSNGPHPGGTLRVSLLHISLSVSAFPARRPASQSLYAPICRIAALRCQPFIRDPATNLSQSSNRHYPTASTTCLGPTARFFLLRKGCSIRQRRGPAHRPLPAAANRAAGSESRARNGSPLRHGPAPPPPTLSGAPFGGSLSAGMCASSTCGGTSA